MCHGLQQLQGNGKGWSSEVMMTVKTLTQQCQRYSRYHSTYLLRREAYPKQLSYKSLGLVQYRDHKLQQGSKELGKVTKACPFAHHACRNPQCAVAKIQAWVPRLKGERGKGEGPGEGGGSQGILGEGPGVADLQRCWGCDEQSYQG